MQNDFNTQNKRQKQKSERNDAMVPSVLLELLSRMEAMNVIRRLRKLFCRTSCICVMFALLALAYDVTRRYSAVLENETSDTSVGSSSLPETQCFCNPMRSAGTSLGVAVVVMNEEPRLEKLINTLMNVSVVTKLFIIDQGSTDKSFSLVARYSSKHRSRISWTSAEETGFNELSSPLVSSLIAREGLEWTLLQDADEALSSEFLGDLPNLLQSQQNDGYLLTRCNDHGYPEGVTLEHKTRLWRTGRALPNIGFGTEFIKACEKCWVQHQPGTCAIQHQKSASELLSDGERYHKICAARCASSSREQASAEFPDCHVYEECYSLFARPATSEPTPT
jgi:hypothetical protein